MLRQPVPLDRFREHVFSGACDFVVLARRALLALRNVFFLPLRNHQARLFHPPQSGIDRSARQAGDVHDVKAVSIF